MKLGGAGSQGRWRLLKGCVGRRGLRGQRGEGRGPAGRTGAERQTWLVWDGEPSGFAAGLTVGGGAGPLGVGAWTGGALAAGPPSPPTEPPHGAEPLGSRPMSHGDLGGPWTSSQGASWRQCLCLEAEGPGWDRHGPSGAWQGRGGPEGPPASHGAANSADPALATSLQSLAQQTRPFAAGQAGVRRHRRQPPAPWGVRAAGLAWAVCPMSAVRLVHVRLVQGGQTPGCNLSGRDRGLWSREG